jgi:peptidoglycan/xylan/chitin deacetylase (PgdA/CDA1 family)
MIGWVMGGTAGLAGLVVAGYNTMAPRSQLYGRTFIGSAPGRRELALTFDDGPNDPYTLHVLEVLAKHGVTATFFMIGRYVKRRPEIAAAVARGGHVIGNHTFTHPNLIFRTPAQVRSEIAACEQALDDAVERNHSPLFRPPWGARTPLVLRTVRELGMTPVLWSVTGFDWNATSAADIKNEVVRQVRGGDVVLLHDGGHKHMGVDRSYTVQAVDDLIRKCKEEGYAFRTISEMVAAQERSHAVSV